MNRNFFRTFTLAAALGVLAAACNDQQGPTSAPVPLAPHNDVALTTPGGPTTINGGYWYTTYTLGTGTGSLKSFLRFQASPTESGFNTDAAQQLDNVGGNFTHALSLNQIPQFEEAGITGLVREFFFDANEDNSADGAPFDITQFQVYVCYTGGTTAPASYTTVQLNAAIAANTCRVAYDINTTINASDGFTSGSGSGADYRILIPATNFDAFAGANSACPYTGATSTTSCGYYIIVRATATGTDATFEEISTADRPVPGTLVIRKRVVNDNGGTATAAAFGLTTSATATLNFDAGVADGANTTLYTSQTIILSTTPTAYTLRENDIAGYTEGTWSCTAGTVTNATISAGSVTVGGGENAVCTITNDDQAGTLIIRKISMGGIGTFDFTSAGAALPSPAVSGAFSLTTATAGVAVQQSFTVMANTAYGVTESAKTGWTFSGRACVITNAGGGGSSVPTDGTTQPGAITVGVGATVTCTYTNTIQPGTLVIRKISMGGIGTFDFTSASAALPSPAVSGAFSLTTATAGVAVQQSFSVVAGTAYGVTESAKTGWTFNGRACVITNAGAGGSSVPSDGTTQPAAITVGAGATVTCTYTNTIQPGTLVIRKISMGGVGTFNFTSASAALPSPATSGAFSLTTATAGVAVQQSFTVMAGTAYGVSESAKTGWTFNGRACVITDAGAGGSSVPSDGTTQPAAITVGAGATVTCTYTNTIQPGTLIIRKISNAGVGTFNFTSASAALPSPAVSGAFSLTTVTAGVAVQQSFSVVAGTAYGVSESSQTGWTFNGRACVITDAGAGGSSVPSDGTTQPAAITVGAAATVTCTYTNTRQAILRIAKVTTPDGSTTDFTFTPTGGWNGGNTFTVRDNQTPVSSGFVNPGSYGAVETVPAGWALTSRNCVNTVGGSAHTFTQPANGVSVVLGAGEDVTCTFTNTELGTLIVEKVVVGANTATMFSFTKATGTGGSNVNFQLNGVSGTNSSTTGKTLAPGTYRVCETGIGVATWSVSAVAGTTGGTLNPVTFLPDTEGDDFCFDVAVAAGGSSTIRYTNEAEGEGTRTIGYWRNWSSCTKGNQYTKNWAETPEALLDYYLAGTTTPSIYPIGDITEGLDCTEAVNLLSKNAINGDKRPGDVIYSMVAQFLAARLNYAAGAGTCTAATNALASAQTLLDAINFVGTGSYKNSGLTAQQRSDAQTLAGILGSYNEGTLGGSCPTHAD